MSAPASLKRAAELGLKVAAALSFLAPLLTRLVVGQAFFLTGRGKWQHFENTVTFFTELGIPFPEANAAFVASLELVGGICLILGLFTRFMSAGLLSTMVVALLTADKERFLESWSPTSDIGPLDVLALRVLAVLPLAHPLRTRCGQPRRPAEAVAGARKEGQGLEVLALGRAQRLVAREDLAVGLEAQRASARLCPRKVWRQHLRARGAARRAGCGERGREVAQLHPALAPPAQELDLVGREVLGLHDRGGAVVFLEPARR